MFKVIKEQYNVIFMLIVGILISLMLFLKYKNKKDKILGLIFLALFLLFLMYKLFYWR